MAIGLLEAAAAGAAANVTINLDGLKDDAFKWRVSAETSSLSANVATRAADARARL